MILKGRHVESGKYIFNKYILTIKGDDLVSVEQMREAVINVYLSDKWKKKVSKMKDAQIIAVYHAFLNSKKIK